MATKHPTSSNYIPGSVPRLGNWPENLRMPPKRQVFEKKQVEKQPKPDPSESSPWDFSDLPS